MPQEAKADALIGTVLEGRFHVEQLLGEGGMGRVYVADEKRLQRRCALKVLLPELAGDKACVERFLREAQAIAQIHHENVVDIYHLGDDSGDGVVFFAMELLQGEDLETRLADREDRLLTWEQVCQWLAQAAGAVAAVHAAGMIHRDLKPSNIFLARRRDGRQRVKLLDFGIVKTTNRAALTSTGAAIGTPYYMSPEQVLALPLDPRADIYSLGAVLFEALAGRPVFLGEALQVAMQHCNVTAPKLSVAAPGLAIPPELEALVAQMLAKDPAERQPPSATGDVKTTLPDDDAPFRQGGRLATILVTSAEALRALAVLLNPVTPKAAAGLWTLLGAQGPLGALADQQVATAGVFGQLPPGTPITKGPSLFPRLEDPKDALL